MCARSIPKGTQNMEKRVVSLFFFLSEFGLLATVLDFTDECKILIFFFL